MKNIEINMSNLSQAQKKMCVELIAQSNIKFQQKDNQYVAQIKLNHPPNADNTQKQMNKGELKKKQPFNPLNGGKKLLARAVKIGDLKKFQELHSSIEVYVYPKRMPILTLCELIQSSYDKFWAEHKKKSAQVRKISFAQWFYKNMIYSLRDKLKIEQMLVNLIDSLNHFIQKEPGIKIFYNFLSENWPTDSFFYFLVLRGILEQVTQQKILERQGGNGMMKLKNNPYEKLVSDQQVRLFLSTLYGGGLSCSRSKPKPLQYIYQALTKRMFWQEQKKKNYIYFFDFLQHLVLQFMDNEVSSCDMSLSKTQDENQSISDLMTQGHFNHEQPHNSSKMSPPQAYIMELDPADEERMLERKRQQRQVKSAQSLSFSIMSKVNQIYNKLNVSPSLKTSQCISNLVESLVSQDKNLWIRYRGQISQSELYAIQRLQALYREQIEGGIITNKLIKNCLLIPALRREMVEDIGY